MSLLRLTLILAAGFCFYLYLADYGIAFLLTAIAFVVAFAVALKFHWRLRRLKVRIQNLLAINQHEMAYLNGDLSAFENGERFKDPEHIYANDLDLFGESSLYQHINRTVTERGAEGLAMEMMRTSVLSISEKQEAIKELAALAEWRQDFEATGLEVEEKSPPL